MQSLAKKLMEVQRKIQPIRKDSENPHFHNKYFDVNSMIAAVRPIINEVGLVVLQPLGISDGKQTIKTILIDPDSGETLETETPLPPSQDAQKAGSSITYFRRYALASALLLEGEDDDGNGSRQDAFDQLPPMPDEPRYEPAEPPRPQAAKQAADFGNCEKCGAEKVLNPKTGKVFCKEKCWTK